MEEDQLHAASTASMAHEFSSFKQQQESEEDIDGSYLRTFRDMDLFVDDAIRTITEIEERAKDFKQRLLQLQMRRHDIKNQYSDHRPREEVAAEPSDQPSTINDESPAQTHHKFRLCFNGSLKSTIYTNRPLQGQSNREIEIAICADDQIITSGRLASLSVEIVALEKDHSCRGQWTEEDFDRQIRKSRDGQRSVLDGECVVELVNGKASLGNIRFKEHSTGTRSREFVLAARVCRSENIRVEEAFMHPPFVVLVERSKGNEKSCLPKLTDKVYTLKSIARNGSYAKRLEKANIHTVGDFLKVLNKDRNKLHQIMQIKMVPAWDAMVKHALECDLSHHPELRSYKIESKNVSLFFNCVDGLVGAEFNDVFVATDMFDPTQKAFVDGQLEQAHSKLDGMPVDYVLENNHPVKILTNIVAPGSSHQTTLQAENLSPSSRIDGAAAPGHSLGDANLNPACQSSSELSHPVCGNGHANQGLHHNGVPNPKGYTTCHADTMDKEWTPNTMPGSSSEETFVGVRMPSCFPQACGTSNPCDHVMESNHATPTLLGASSQSVSGATFQGHICSTDPEGGVISPDSTTDHVDNMEETWMKSLVEDCFARQTNTKPIYSPEELPIYSPERTFEAQGTTIFCQEDNGSEAPNDASLWPQQVADSALFMLDETIYDPTCSGYNPGDS